MYMATFDNSVVTSISPCLIDKPSLVSNPETLPDSDTGFQQNIVSQPKKVPRSVSVVARPGSSLAKSDPMQVPETMRRCYSLNLIRENRSYNEFADGKCRDKKKHVYFEDEVLFSPFSPILLFPCSSLSRRNFFLAFRRSSVNCLCPIKDGISAVLFKLILTSGREYVWRYPVWSIKFQEKLSYAWDAIEPGLVRVLEILESPEILICFFPVLQSPEKQRVLFQSSKKYLESCDEQW